MTCRSRFLARPLGDRFWEKVDTSGECWLWTGATSKPNGFDYGVMIISGRTVTAHRISWELHHGPIPHGLWVLHRCDVPRCVNPDHLFLGTQRDNMLDREAKGRGMRARHWDNCPAKGDRHVRAKLTTAQVLAIREQVKHRSHAVVARDYNVARRTIDDIASRKTWRHVSAAGDLL